MGPQSTEPFAPIDPGPNGGTTAPGTDPLAIASLVAGIVALASMCCCGCMSVPAGLTAIVTGILVAVKPESSSKALAYVGIGAGVLSLLLTLVSMAMGVGMNVLSLLQQQ